MVEWKERIKEFEDIDRESGKSLLDIEKRFRDVKASAGSLISELQTLNQMAKEGANMMKTMVGKFEKATMKINTLKESVKKKNLTMMFSLLV